MDKRLKTISLSQEVYINKILKHFNLQDIRLVSMPMNPNTKLSKDQCAISENDKSCMKNVPYRQAIGSLM
jgi:hypothetical protein